MNRAQTLLLLLPVVLLSACAAAVQHPVAAPSAAPAVAKPAPSVGAAGESAGAASGSTARAVSVVRFDDLGVSFAVPAGFKVLGDDDFAARIRASANPTLTASLESRAAKQKGIPLLSLARDAADRDGALAVTVSVTVVPADANASELLSHQRAAMVANLESFRVTEGPTEHIQDGVVGTELTGAYLLRSSGQARSTGSFMRMYVRRGVAYLAVAVWPEASARGEEARLTLDGLRFYEPAP